MHVRLRRAFEEKQLVDVLNAIDDALDKTALFGPLA